MRKLAAAGFSFAAGTAAAHWLLPYSAIYASAAALLMLILPALLLRGDIRRRALICLIFAASGLGWYGLYSLRVLAPAEALAGQELIVTARVRTPPLTEGSYTSMLVRLQDSNLPAANVQVDDYSSLTSSELAPGDLLRLHLKLRSAHERLGEATDGYIARDIQLRAYLLAEPELIGASDSLYYLPARLAQRARAVILELFPEDVRGFALALLTGDTSVLARDYALDNALSTAGLRHVVAVSGMHLSFLYGAVGFLAGRRRAAFIGLPAVWLFALFVGFSPSVVRAAVMLSLMMLAPILRREADGATSLAAALLVLLIACPPAIASAGLQLSFASMAGIIALASPIASYLGRKVGREGRVKSALLANIPTSLGALVFTTPLTALHFGYVSLVSPIANLVALWAVSAAFLSGWAALLLGLIWLPIGKTAALLAALPLRFIIFVVKTLAALPHAALYAANRLLPLAILFCYLVFGVAWLMRGRGGLRPLAPAVASAAALAAAVSAALIYSNGAGSITVLNVGQGQCVTLMGGSGCAVIDCGGNYGSDPGAIAAEHLLSKGRGSIDALILTHLHSDHANGAARLMSRVQVKRLYLPGSAPDSDNLLAEILQEAERRDTEVIYVTEDMALNFGALSLRLYKPALAGNENERCTAVLAEIGGYRAMVTGDMGSAAERELVERVDLPDADLLVVGHHGSRGSAGLDLLSELNAELAVISVGHNSYKLPSEDTLFRLGLYGMEILRTDVDGSITVRMDLDG